MCISRDTRKWWDCRREAAVRAKMVRVWISNILGYQWCEVISTFGQNIDLQFLLSSQYTILTSNTRISLSSKVNWLITYSFKLFTTIHCNYFPNINAQLVPKSTSITSQVINTHTTYSVNTTSAISAFHQSHRSTQIHHATT